MVFPFVSLHCTWPALTLSSIRNWKWSSEKDKKPIKCFVKICSNIGFKNNVKLKTTVCKTLNKNYSICITLWIVLFFGKTIMIFAIQPRQIHMIWRGRKRADTVIYYAFARMQPIISFFFFSFHHFLLEKRKTSSVKSQQFVRSTIIIDASFIARLNKKHHFFPLLQRDLIYFSERISTSPRDVQRFNASDEGAD